MYVEPLAAGQIGDEGVLGGGVVVARLTDWVTMVVLVPGVEQKLV